MIKCQIEDVVTGKKARLRSYISDITDTITPSWNTQEYIGRPDAVHTYKSTTRSCAFTLKFAATSRGDMFGMYKKVNFLYGLAYPHIGGENIGNYGAVQQTMVGPLVRMTIGDWLYRTPGYFKSISTTIDNNFPWEINLEDSDQIAQLPQILQVAIEFEIIGDGPHTSAVSSVKAPAGVAGIHVGGMPMHNNERPFFTGLPIAPPEE